MVSSLDKRYITLLSDEEVIVNSVLSDGRNDELIIEKFGVSMNRSILRRLGSTILLNTDLWLNDQVATINFVIVLLLINT